MCFYSNTNKTKIANKPIRVYKLLVKINETPMMCYRYYRGLNIPENPKHSCIYFADYKIYKYGGG